VSVRHIVLEETVEKEGGYGLTRINRPFTTAQSVAILSRQRGWGAHQRPTATKSYGYVEVCRPGIKPPRVMTRSFRPGPAQNLFCQGETKCPSHCLCQRSLYCQECEELYLLRGSAIVDRPSTSDLLDGGLDSTLIRKGLIPSQLMR